jgi:hypothetical protein
MMQHLFGLLLLGGTSGMLLGSSIMKADGPTLIILGVISFVFVIGFVSHARTLGKQE